MTTDEQRRAFLAQFAITSHLGDLLTAAKRNAELAVGTPDADQRQTVSSAFLQAMEDGYTLVMHTGGGGDADTYLTLRQRAAVTRQWLRDQGYVVPVYPKEPGL